MLTNLDQRCIFLCVLLGLSPAAMATDEDGSAKTVTAEKATKERDTVETENRAAVDSAEAVAEKLVPTILSTVSADEVCKDIGNKLGSVSVNECQRQQMAVTEGVSVNGTPILIKTYPPLEQREPRGKVLLIGGIHGDEYSSVSVVFKWMNILNQYHSGLFHWRIAPLVNPDGLLQANSQRMNAHGVDLNRNFPMAQDWEVALEDYWIEKTGRNPRRYPGDGPLSEPETRWLAEEIKSFDPDVIVSVHAPYGVVDYDGPRDGPYRLGRLYLDLLGTYPGSLGRYAGVQLNKPLVTIELPYAGIMPSAEEINDIWVDLIRWLNDNIAQENSTVVAE